MPWPICLQHSGFFYFAVRDCCYQAAKEQSFTDANAKAKLYFQNGIDAWKGLKAKGDPKVVVVIRDMSGSSTAAAGTREVAGPLKGSDIPVNTQNNVYMLKVYCDGQIQPLIQTGNFSMFSNIPGLTGPFPIQMTYQVYTENPTGLGT